LTGVLGLTCVQSNVHSSKVTVVLLHIILGIYIHRTFLSDTLQKPTKQDKPLRTVRPLYRTGIPLLSRCCILYIFFNNYKYWVF